MDRIAQRPLLGYGFGAFWDALGPGEAVRAAVGWVTPHAHNGFLDLWLDMGLVGLLTFVTRYMVGVRRAWAMMRSSADAEGFWPLAYLLVFLLINITETAVYQNLFVWAIFVATVAEVAQFSGDQTGLRASVTEHRRRVNERLTIKIQNARATP
jgi:O-antigen ligase